MSFLSLKTVPTISGCVIDSPPPVGQIVFSSLEALMFYGWKAALFNMAVNGSFSLTDDDGTDTYVDSFSGPTVTGGPFAPSPLPAVQKMSDFVCNRRPPGRHLSVFEAELGVLIPDLLVVYSTAHRHGSQFWYDGWTFQYDAFSFYASGPDVGSLQFDGVEVSRLYYADLYSPKTFTLLTPYVINITTIEENTQN
jgi:hypothetical protein